MKANRLSLEERKKRDLARTDASDTQALANIERYYSDTKYREKQERIQRRIMGEIEEALGASRK